AFSAECKTGTTHTQGAYIYGIVGGKLVQRAFLTNLPGGYAPADRAKIVRKMIARIHWIGDYLYTIADGYITSYRLPADNMSIGGFELVGTFDARIATGEVTVTFLMDKDGEEYETRNVAIGERLTDLPPDPEREGYTFTGWRNNAGTLGLAFNFSSNTISEPVIVYAAWTAE
ncbi:MAG: InlB B-repeat-containing protein, partial [Firmicutes bacterium]|nr:InlB B-repeat-containing protein [Bacillota bacterium]